MAFTDLTHGLCREAAAQRPPQAGPRCPGDLWLFWLIRGLQFKAQHNRQDGMDLGTRVGKAVRKGRLLSF